MGLRQERFASESCRSTSGPDVVDDNYIRPARHRDRPEARRACDRSSSGTRSGRTRRARCDESARRFRSSAGSWSWCGCDRRPRPRGRAVVVAFAAAEFGATVSQHPRQPDAMLIIERKHPIIEDLGRGDRRLAVIEFGEGDLGIGIDEGLLIDPPDTLQGTDIKRVLGSAIAGALALKLA